MHVHRDEAEYVQRVTGAEASDLAVHDSGDVLEVGAIRIERRRLASFWIASGLRWIDTPRRSSRFTIT